TARGRNFIRRSCIMARMKWNLLCVFSMIMGISNSARAANLGFQITALSSRPDMISGGDVLVRVDMPDKVLTSQAAIRLNGQDITAAFRSDPETHALIGLVK